LNVDNTIKITDYQYIKVMGLVNIKLKGKYTLRCLKFLVFWFFIPFLIASIYLIVFQTEKIEILLKVL